MHIQAVIFPNNQWTSKQALGWLKAHDYKPIKTVHKTKHYLRYRLLEPSLFTHFITKILTHQDGRRIDLVIGYP